jgi:hypothetical protein
MNETNVTIPNNYTITGDMDEFGMFWGNITVTDGDLWDLVYIYLTIENVNDAPTGEWGTGYAAMIDKKTGEEVNVSVANLMDVDGDDLTVIWKIDGTVVTGWNMEYFVYNWSTAKIYNVSAYVSDGIETVEIGYFHVNVTISNMDPVIEDIEGPTDEVKEGDPFTLIINVSDDQDTYIITWTRTGDPNWNQTGKEITISNLEPGTYTFTATVVDPYGKTATQTYSVTIVEKAADGDDNTMVIIIIVVVILLVILLVIILVVMKGKKKEEEIPEESEPMGEEDMAVETGDMPMEEGYEQPVEEPIEEEGYEQPVEEPVEESYEEPVDESMPPAPEEPVAPEVPAQPPIPPQPEPPIPPQ